MKIYAFLQKIKITHNFFYIIASFILIISSLSVQACNWASNYFESNTNLKTAILFGCLIVVYLILCVSLLYQILFFLKFSCFGDKRKMTLLILNFILCTLFLSIVTISYKELNLLYLFTVDLTPLILGIIFSIYFIIISIVSYRKFSQKISALLSSNILNIISYEYYGDLLSNLTNSKSFFAIFIKTLRMQLSLSKKDFGNMFSVSSTTITNWENSKSFPSMNVILHIEQISKTELKKLLFIK